MLVVEFGGGLGNQMSQYAMMKLLEHNYPNTKVYGDISIYKKKLIHNGFELGDIYKNIKINYMNSFLYNSKCRK